MNFAPKSSKFKNSNVDSFILWSTDFELCLTILSSVTLPRKQLLKMFQVPFICNIIPDDVIDNDQALKLRKIKSKDEVKRRSEKCRERSAVPSIATLRQGAGLK